MAPFRRHCHRRAPESPSPSSLPAVTKAPPSLVCPCPYPTMGMFPAGPCVAAGAAVGFSGWVLVLMLAVGNCSWSKTNMMKTSPPVRYRLSSPSRHPRPPSPSLSPNPPPRTTTTTTTPLNQQQPPPRPSQSPNPTPTSSSPSQLAPRAAPLRTRARAVFAVCELLQRGVLLLCACGLLGSFPAFLQVIGSPLPSQ